MPIFIPTMSQDGYFRLSFKQLPSINLHHLHSGLDPERNIEPINYDRASAIEGYTEWITQTVPSISLSWDWKLSIDNKNIICTLAGHPYSNIQITSCSNQDLPEPVSQELLKALIENISWEDTVISYIQNI